MTTPEILRYIDHTRLAATSTWEEIKQLCEQALEFHTASVCIPPCYVKRVKDIFPDLNICTVIGFPLGYMTTRAKAFEASDAAENGADEIDMVINLCEVKNGNWDVVKDDISAVRAAVPNKLLKVIVETCYLTEEEKIRLCKIVTEAGAEYIKTSTGFGTAGAQKEDISLFKANIGENVKIKAAGGIRSKEDMEEFIALGCSRIGTSGAARLCGKE